MTAGLGQSGTLNMREFAAFIKEMNEKVNKKFSTFVFTNSFCIYKQLSPGGLFVRR